MDRYREYNRERNSGMVGTGTGAVMVQNKEKTVTGARTEIRAGTWVGAVAKAGARLGHVQEQWYDQHRDIIGIGQRQLWDRKRVGTM